MFLHVRFVVFGRNKENILFGECFQNIALSEKSIYLDPLSNGDGKKTHTKTFLCFWAPLLKTRKLLFFCPLFFGKGKSFCFFRNLFCFMILLECICVFPLSRPIGLILHGICGEPFLISPSSYQWLITAFMYFVPLYRTEEGTIRVLGEWQKKIPTYFQKSTNNGGGFILACWSGLLLYAGIKYTPSMPICWIQRGLA